MGRKTLETFPSALPKREHIVITGNRNYEPPFPVTLTGSLEEAVSRVGEDELAFIIGGGTIYHQAMELATHIELTRIHAVIDGDTYFPAIQSDHWQLLWNQYHPADEQHAYSFTFEHYIKKDLREHPDSLVPWLSSG